RPGTRSLGRLMFMLCLAGCGKTPDLVDRGATLCSHASREEGAMRGGDGQQAGMFSYVSPERRIPADHPLRPGREMTDEVLRQLSPRFARLYPKTGRPSVAPRSCCARCSSRSSTPFGASGCPWNSSSTISLFRWFVGLSMDDPVWDVTVFTKNRERLLRGDIAEAFFQRVLELARAER